MQNINELFLTNPILIAQVITIVFTSIMAIALLGTIDD